MGCACSSDASCATTNPNGYQKVSDTHASASCDPAVDVPVSLPTEPSEKMIESFVWVEESETLPVLLQSLTAEETQEVGVCDPPELESKAFVPKDREVPWWRFLALWVCCCVASGMLPGQSLFVEILADAEVFSSVCEGSSSGCRDQFLVLTSVFGVCQSLAYGFSAPIGLLYDRWGARNIGTAGALCCALGLLLLCWSVLGATSGHDFLTCNFVALGVLLCDFGSMLNSFAFIGLIWHFPRRQTLVIALINSTYQASSLLPILLRAGMSCLELPLYVLMLAWTALIFATVYFCSMLIPSQVEYFQHAKLVLGVALAKPEDMGMRQMICRAVEVLQLHHVDHLVSGFALAAGFALPGFYSSLAASYGEQLFGDKSDGKKLVEVNLLCTLIVGIVLGPLAGLLADGYGLEALILLLVGTAAVACSTVSLASWPAQVICTFSTVLFISLFSIYISRYILLYSPPSRFGAVQGIYSAAVVLMSTPWSLAGMAAMSMLPPGLNEYRVPMLALGLTGVLLLALYAAYCQQHPPPECPPMLPEDEADLAKLFGCGNLEEVCEVTGVRSKALLVKKMGSENPEDQLSILKNIDAHKMMEMMAKRSAEDIAEMMEAEESAVTQDIGDEEAEKVGQVPPEESCDPAEAATEDVRARGLYLTRIVKLSDAQAVREYLLTEPLEDMWRVALDMEKWQTQSEQAKMDKDFNKTIPSKELASILRKRPELKTFVQRAIMREVERKIRKLQARKK